MKEYATPQIKAINKRKQYLEEIRKDFYDESYYTLSKLIKEYNGKCITCNWTSQAYLSEVLRWERFHIVDCCYPKDVVLTTVNEVLHKICEEQDCIGMWKIYKIHCKANKHEYNNYL